MQYDIGGASPRRVQRFSPTSERVLRGKLSGALGGNTVYAPRTFFGIVEVIIYGQEPFFFICHEQRTHFVPQ